MSETLSSIAPLAVRNKPSVLRALIHQEWQLCRGFIIGLSVLWITGLWVLLLFHHPAWFMVLGLIYVLAVSSNQGGRDVMDGTEEFSFTLPPGRGPLFVSRLTPGLLFLIANGLLGSVAIAWDLPQRVWSVVFSSGLTDPFPRVEEPLWYAMALLVPVAAHTISFSIAALVGTRAGVNLSWLAGFAGVGAIVLVGTVGESLLWKNPNGFLTSPALLAGAVLVPLAAYRAYLRKEASGRGGSAGGTNDGKTLLIIAAVVAVAVVLVLLMLVFYTRTNTVQQSTARDAYERAHQAEQVERIEAIKQNAPSRK